MDGSAGNATNDDTNNIATINRLLTAAETNREKYNREYTTLGSAVTRAKQERNACHNRYLQQKSDTMSQLRIPNIRLSLWIYNNLNDNAKKLIPDNHNPVCTFSSSKVFYLMVHVPAYDDGGKEIICNNQVCHLTVVKAVFKEEISQAFIQSYVEVINTYADVIQLGKQEIINKRPKNSGFIVHLDPYDENTKCFRLRLSETERGEADALYKEWFEDKPYVADWSGRKLALGVLVEIFLNKTARFAQNGMTIGLHSNGVSLTASTGWHPAKIESTDVEGSLVLTKKDDYPSD
jgi:hypothetical protein